MPLIAENGGVTSVIVTSDGVVIGEDDYVVVFTEDIVKVKEVVVPTEEDNVLDQPRTKSMDMTDNQIRRYLIDNVWIKHNMPVMAWDKFITSANWLNLANKVAFIETLKKEWLYLARLPNGTTHTAEYDRVRDLTKNVDLVIEEYEEAPQFAIERFKDKIAGLTLAVKITVGISIAVGVIFGLFVLYNYLKSYGTELGIKKARD